MPRRMLIDATHPEQTRVAVVDGRRLYEFDFETASRRQLKGNIYLAKVVRIEPSLQAAFVEYGGNRHGFLAFSEIHSDYYRIPVADRQALEEELAQDQAASPGAEEQPYFDDASVPAEEDLNAPFEDEEIEESHITSSALPPAIGLGEPQSGLISRPFAPETDAGTEAESAGEEPPGFDPAADGENAGEEEHLSAAAEGVPSGEAVANGAVPVESVGGDEIIDTQREQRRRRMIRRYKIQEVIKRGQIMLIQVVKEERGNKGAALTTYLSLAGRYCVLMPNTGKGGGISRKITSMQDRRRMKDLLGELEVPDGMAVILRTAGMERGKAEVRRDLEYLLRLWDSIREMTLKSIAPCLIYEEANLIKRAMRDLYAPDIEAILVEGDAGYVRARDFMRMLMPGHARRVHHYRDNVVPLFFRYQVENQINALHSPVVRLRSGGYLVINQAEALVAIDVNSGRATRERHIEETATRTNLEAADEIARQLRLRDLAGLIVIDFIDMEDGRNNAAVERRLKEAMRHDRARVQIGRISHFGLMELSRQRLRPSLLELNFEKCPHCHGTGHIRLVESTALLALHALEEEGIRQSASEAVISMPSNAAQYILNNKRDALTSIERRYGMLVRIRNDEDVVPPEFPIERVRGKKAEEQISISLGINDGQGYAATDRGLAGQDAPESIEEPDDDTLLSARSGGEGAAADEDGGASFDEGFDGGTRRGGRRRGRRGGRRRSGGRFPDNREGDTGAAAGAFPPVAEDAGNIGNTASPGQDAGVPGNEFQPDAFNRPGGEFRPRRGGRNRGRFRDRDRDGERGARGQRGPRGGTDRHAVPQQGFAPGSLGVFEIDTTPKDLSVMERAPVASASLPQEVASMPVDRPANESRPVPAARETAEAVVTPVSSSPKPVEILDQGLVTSPEKKKSGWWSKLTGAS